MALLATTSATSHPEGKPHVDASQAAGFFSIPAPQAQPRPSEFSHPSGGALVALPFVPDPAPVTPVVSNPPAPANDFGLGLGFDTLLG